MRYSWADDGNRIEADICLEGRHGIVRQTTVEAGRSVGLPNDWVEDVLPAAFGHGPSWPAGFPTGMYPSWERPGLRILSAPASLLVPMAFLASLRPMDDISYNDLEPAIRIAAQAGIKSARCLRRLVAPYLERKEKDDGDLARMIEKRLSQFEYALDRFGCGVVLRSKPKSLADVAAMAREDCDCFGPASGEFQQAFYLEKDRAARQTMLDPVPIPTGDPRTMHGSEQSVSTWPSAGVSKCHRGPRRQPSWADTSRTSGQTRHWRATSKLSRRLRLFGDGCCSRLQSH